MSAKHKIFEYFDTEAHDEDNNGEDDEDEDDGSSCEGDSSFIEESDEGENTEESVSDEYASESELSPIAVKTEVFSVYSSSSSDSENTRVQNSDEGHRKGKTDSNNHQRKKGVCCINSVKRNVCITTLETQ